MAEIFDRAHFEHMTGDDAALQLEVIGLFRGQVAEWTGALSPDAPAPDWREAVHKLKGSARGIGFGALAEAREQAEAAQGDGVAPALRALGAALDQALAALA